MSDASPLHMRLEYRPLEYCGCRYGLEPEQFFINSSVKMFQTTMKSNTQSHISVQMADAQLRVKLYCDRVTACIARNGQEEPVAFPEPFLPTTCAFTDGNITFGGTALTETSSSTLKDFPTLLFANPKGKSIRELQKGSPNIHRDAEGRPCYRIVTDGKTILLQPQVVLEHLLEYVITVAGPDISQTELTVFLDMPEKRLATLSQALSCTFPGMTCICNDATQDGFTEEDIEDSADSVEGTSLTGDEAMNYILRNREDPPADKRPTSFRVKDALGRTFVDIYVQFVSSVLPPWLYSLVKSDMENPASQEALVSNGNATVDGQGRTKFMRQILRCKAAVRYMDRQTNMDLQDCNGQTAMMMWIDCIRTEPPQYIRQTNMDLHDTTRSTAMIYWINSIMTEPPRWIRHTDIDEQDMNGATAMMAWIDSTKTEPPESIRQYNMDVVDIYGNTAMMYWICAIKSDPPESIFQSNNDIQNLDGNTVLMLWILKVIATRVLLSSLAPKQPFVSWLTNSSADAQKGMYSIPRYVLQHDMNIRNKKGNTAMMVWIECIKTEPPASIRQSNRDIQNSEGMTALMLWIEHVMESDAASVSVPAYAGVGKFGGKMTTGAVPPGSSIPDYILQTNKNLQNGRGQTAMMVWIDRLGTMPPGKVRQTNMDIIDTKGRTAMMHWICALSLEPPEWVRQSDMKLRDADGRTAMDMWVQRTDSQPPTWMECN